ncbi:hypothetical protein [[Mycoplasma] collis]|uniref:hypothetical protein n=1 Tax=[Mycoplasma] collis TaxID=2127 RepID=UPI00051B183E|nr:hypothetical protein [[Mycoplasma] collis]
MLNIFISKNLIKNLINLRKKDWNEDINEFDIYSKIQKILIYDEKINEKEKLNFQKIDDRFQGIYIKELNETICFTQMLSFLSKIRSRNTFISQNSKTAQEFANKINSNLSISLNPFDLEKKVIIKQKSIIKDLIQLLHLSVKINKSIEWLNNEIEFSNLNEFIDYRNFIKNKNKGNNSTFIKIFEDIKQIILYGKLDGANYSDTINTAKIIQLLNKKNLIYFLFH